MCKQAWEYVISAVCGRPAFGGMSNGGTQGMGHGRGQAESTQSGKARQGKGKYGRERRPESQGHGKCACWGKKEKSCKKGPCPGLSRAGQLPQYLGGYVPHRLAGARAMVYSTCNNVGECRSWEVAARGEWPNGRMTTDD